MCVWGGAGFCHLPGEQWLLTTLADSLEELQAGQGDKLKYNFVLACRALEARQARGQNGGPLAAAGQDCGRALKPSSASLGLETSSGTDRPVGSVL